MNKYKEYFYVIKHNENEESLCFMEAKYLFNQGISKKEFFSERYISPSRSPFIKHLIKVIYKENSLEQVIENIVKDELSFEKFKVQFVRFQGCTLNYEKRLEAMRSIGLKISGLVEMNNPKIILGITVIDDKWVFGVYEKDDCNWHKHDEKPYSYSNALSTKVARSIVNIAVGNNHNKSVIDPCCGVGTVVIEGISMGINIKGYEINPQIAFNAKRNMESLGYKIAITKGDMREIKEYFDVAIVDMPYGLFTKTSLEEQVKIIKKTREIAKEAIFITFENMDEIFIKSGFNIIDKGSISKNSFTRYINICN